MDEAVEPGNKTTIVFFNYNIPLHALIGTFIEKLYCGWPVEVCIFFILQNASLSHSEPARYIQTPDLSLVWSVLIPRAGTNQVLCVCVCVCVTVWLVYMSVCVCVCECVPSAKLIAVSLDKVEDF